MHWCLEKKQEIVEERKRPRSEAEEHWGCECSWRKLICCNVYKENYQKFMKAKMEASMNEVS